MDKQMLRARTAEVDKTGVLEDGAAVFAPHWPTGLNLGDAYRIPCDDKGRNGGSWLQVYIAPDCDVHVMMQDWEEMPKGDPSPLPTLRSRTSLGGGRHDRTHQALLWLAQAIRLDTEEREARSSP